jgi:ribonucleoside-diphosphate reductase beta chain
MLTWDDEVTPTPSKTVSSGSPTNREAMHSPLAAVVSIPQPALRTLDDGAPAPVAAIQTIAAQSTSQRRVQAADKRIINGPGRSTWRPAPTTGCRRKST